MKYLLDTNIISHLMTSQSNTDVIDFIQTLSIDDVYMSSITALEIKFGIEKKRATSPEKASKLEALYNEILKSCQLISLTPSDGYICGELKAKAQSEGLNLTELDMMIAGHAKSRNLCLISQDKAFQHFSHLLNVKII